MIRRMASRSLTFLLLAAVTLAGAACVKKRGPAVSRPPSALERPRIAASASTLGATNAWRPVGSLPSTPAPVPSPPPKVASVGTPGQPPPVPPAATPITPAPPARLVVAVTNAPTVSPPAAAPTGHLAAAVAYRLRPLDPVVINLRGIPPKDEQIEDQIDEAGVIRLTYLPPVKAAGKTATELEDEIERLYIDGKIYKTITVQVVLPAQSYFIEGEVKMPGRIQLVSGMTLMQAIAQAGGYTDFADRTDIRIVRAGKTIPFNGKDIARYPERDVRIEPGDRVIVGRSYI